MNKHAALTPKVKKVLLEKGTERPFSSPYCTPQAHGTYLCRGCGSALFRADGQFASQCGWPSFDVDIDNQVLRQTDADGHRTEILCATCQGHLGHVFEGEHLTARNTRYCVNAIAVEHVLDDQVMRTEEAIVAGGCFWGVQHLFEQCPGVLLTEVGYIGGDIEDPSYEQVCRLTTGHLEAVRVVFDCQKTNYEQILKYFFEIHDPAQADGQGPDLGPQYRSAIFVYSTKQADIAKQVIEELQSMGVPVSTRILSMETFWPGESSHQAYYQKNGQTPYCHRRTKRFK